MNENLVERFGRQRRAARTIGDQALVWVVPPQLNRKIREYYDESKKTVDGGPWLDRPEVPTSAEILDTDIISSNSSDIVELVPNRPKGAWETKETYLGAQYELLREDALQPLRLAVSRVRNTPEGTEETFNGTVGVYEKVHICGMTCGNKGIALRVTFSLSRVGKKIRWDQSKRLLTGGLVVLTPANDMFQKTAIVATVAARPLDMLDQNPPEIDIYIARPEEMEIDPATEWVMVEDRTSFFEGNKHTLVALQKMMREPFPLSEHLVDAKTKIDAPEYLKQQPRRNLTPILRNNRHQTYENIDMLKQWPAQPSSDMDESQLIALRRILTKRLAIIQGPPGTGKTYVSEQAIKVMLTDRKENDGEPPIIIACQTNHAVDQLLRKIAEFEPEFVRLGGRSKDKEVVKKRTLYEVRKLTSEEPLAGSLKGNANKKMKDLSKEFGVMLTPLKPEKTPLDFAMLEKLGLLSIKQAKTLEDGASKWVQAKLSNPQEARNSPFNVWLGKALISVPLKQQSEEFGFDFEEADLAFEEVKAAEAENAAKDDDDFETLYGLHLPLADNFTARKVTGVTEAKVKEMMKEQDMWKIPEAMRGEVYRYLQRETKKHILTGFREKAKVYNEQAVKRQIGAWEHDENILKKQKVIGMTTTGLSKYRALISALQPKIILIEEAAETLEAPVTVACVPSLQHLILVGDHKQLRPHVQVKAHEDKPFYLNVSLFERLVNNKMEFDTLAKQRRMIPEVRRILYPIYGKLIEDHPSVLDPERRPNVPGMGGVNSFFFTHQWPEARDDYMSCYNPDEALMIMGFVDYLLVNGMKPQDITILTFYNGQRKRILSLVNEIRRSENNIFAEGIPIIVTVDSYQGEENKVVLLSLVRSNSNDQIGFLSNQNRVCVALSRAQCGFYIFGNGMLLHTHEERNQKNIWREVLLIIAGKKNKSERPKIEPLNRLDENLTVRCSNHNKESNIREPADWQTITSAGGCNQKCDGTLPCGHSCVIACHPFSHDSIFCQQTCGKKLPCGHGTCQNDCGSLCSCKTCSNKARASAQSAGTASQTKTLIPFDGTERLMKVKTSSETEDSSKSSAWRSFADEEPKRYEEEAASLPPPKISSGIPGNSKNGQKADARDGSEGVTPKVRQMAFGSDGAADSVSVASSSTAKGLGNAEGKKRVYKQEPSLLD
ncbi:hypothetical protein LTR17_015077 [Elasticomyces elasticus]|nr:hypothetical protein LTR17_015077 [Elasticomyces elasticus]